MSRARRPPHAIGALFRSNPVRITGKAVSRRPPKIPPRPWWFYREAAQPRGERASRERARDELESERHQIYNHEMHAKTVS